MLDEETLDKFIDKALAGETMDGLGDPLAEIAAALTRLNAIEPNEQIKADKHRVMMARAREPRPKRGWNALKNRLSVGIAAGLALVLSSGGVVFAASGSLPGETLYPVKRAAEYASLAFKPSGLTKARAKLYLARIRQAEIKSLMKQGKNKPIGSLVSELNLELIQVGADLKDLRAEGGNGIPAEIRALRKWTTTILEKKAPGTERRRAGGKPTISGSARDVLRPALKEKHRQPENVRPARPAQTKSRRPGRKSGLESNRPEKTEY